MALSASPGTGRQYDFPMVFIDHQLYGRMYPLDSVMHGPKHLSMHPTCVLYLKCGSVSFHNA
jgi:hypothetical protein